MVYAAIVSSSIIAGYFIIRNYHVGIIKKFLDVEWDFFSRFMNPPAMDGKVVSTMTKYKGLRFKPRVGLILKFDCTMYYPDFPDDISTVTRNVTLHYIKNVISKSA